MSAVPVAEVSARAVVRRCREHGNQAQWVVNGDAFACDNCLVRQLRRLRADGVPPPFTVDPAGGR